MAAEDREQALLEALRRAERDAQRWEATAVEMERRQNAALQRAHVAEVALADGRRELAATRAQAGYELIEALADLRAGMAARFGIRLSSRGDDLDDLEEDGS